MIKSEREEEAMISARFKEMGLETSNPAWSSWVLDRLLETAESGPGGLQDLYVTLNAALREWSVQLTPGVASLIKDLVVKGFSQHGSAYRRMDWSWANEELKKDPLPASCYLFLHALPPDVATPVSIVTILRCLHDTAYGQEALATFSDDLNKPEVQRLLGSNGEQLVGKVTGGNGGEWIASEEREFSEYLAWT